MKFAHGKQGLFVTNTSFLKIGWVALERGVLTPLRSRSDGGLCTRNPTNVKCLFGNQRLV